MKELIQFSIAKTPDFEWIMGLKAENGNLKIRLQCDETGKETDQEWEEDLSDFTKNQFLTRLGLAEIFLFP